MKTNSNPSGWTKQPTCDAYDAGYDIALDALERVSNIPGLQSDKGSKVPHALSALLTCVLQSVISMAPTPAHALELIELSVVNVSAHDAVQEMLEELVAEPEIQEMILEAEAS
jgi:hypothetical protein